MGTSMQSNFGGDPETSDRTHLDGSVGGGTANREASKQSSSTKSRRPSSSSSLRKNGTTSRKSDGEKVIRRSRRGSSKDRRGNGTKKAGKASQPYVEDEQAGSCTSSSEDESSSSGDDPEYLKTPGSNYSKGSKVLTMSSVSSRGSSPSSHTAEPSSAKGARRKIKYVAGSDRSKKSSSDQLWSHSEHSAAGPTPEQDCFEVTNVSGNISTWEMRQRFQREFPNEPVPSDTILRQLYRGDKIAAYERVERYKLEFPGEPVPSDEVLKKLYAVQPVIAAPSPQVHAVSLPPTQPAPLGQSTIPAPVTTLQRDQLLRRQDSESNMTFATEVGWEQYGQSSKIVPTGNVPMSIGMGSLLEGDEEEDDFGGHVTSEKITSPSFDTFADFSKSAPQPASTMLNAWPDNSNLPSSTPTKEWPDGFGNLSGTPSMTMPDPNWGNAFPPPNAPPPQDNLSSRSIQQNVLKATSGHFRKTKTGTSSSLESNTMIDDSQNSFEEEQQSNHEWAEFPQDQATNKSNRSKGSGNNKKTKKDKSGKATKNSKSKKKEKKGKKKKDKEEGASSDDDDFFTPKSTSGEKSWWNLNASEKSPGDWNKMKPKVNPPSDEPGTPLSKKKAEAWQKREAWKNAPRTKSAPMQKVDPSDTFQESFLGDSFASFQQQSSVDVGKVPRRGKKPLDRSRHNQTSSKATEADPWGPSTDQVGGMEVGARSNLDGHTSMAWDQSASEMSFHASVRSSDPFFDLSKDKPASQSRRLRDGMDSSTHSGQRQRQEQTSFGSFDAFPGFASGETTRRQVPARSKSADFVGNFFDDFAPGGASSADFEGGRETGDGEKQGKVTAGLLQPSKREHRTARSTERLRDAVHEDDRRRMLRNGAPTTPTSMRNKAFPTYGVSKTQAGTHSGAQSLQKSMNLDGWDSEIPSLFKHSHDDGGAMELQVGGTNEPMSPLTVATKKVNHRLLTSRRRAFN